MRDANVANESPPRKTGTLKVYERTVQSAAACASKPSPSTNWLSSVLLTMVAKSCLYSAPSEPPHVFMHLIFCFLHDTLSSPHALIWKPTLCIHRPPGVKISYLNRRHLPRGTRLAWARVGPLRARARVFDRGARTCRT